MLPTVSQHLLGKVSWSAEYLIDITTSTYMNPQNMNKL